ncbi:hypothetical protein BYT27DRAFT_7181457 [Phlegmacium glaucopus]|nr:hypothetical protein BYT27DRAFT_7181457 [Phlegmacium glaucopus]
MTTPLQIDDHNPLVFYSPNSSWTRGGAAADFDGTSTFTASPGASATLTFTGTEISVWGTITFLANNTPTFVLSSYSIDNGTATTFNASEQAAFVFQQKLFQSAPLSASTPHTLVATLDNNATFFIDYFLITPVVSSTSSSATSSSSSTLSTTSTIPTASSSAQSHSSKVPLGPVLGGTLGGVALLIIAIFVFWFSRRRLKDENQRLKTQVQAYAEPHLTPTFPMQQYPPHASSDTASVYPIISSYTQHPTPGVIPSSKAAQLSVPSRTPGGSLYSQPRTRSDTRSESPEPPGYDG